MVEAAGVELFSVLTAPKLLILRMARGEKKAPLPIPLYVYCTKIFSRSHSAKPHKKRSIPHLAATTKGIFRLPSRFFRGSRICVILNEPTPMISINLFNRNLHPRIS